MRHRDLVDLTLVIWPRDHQVHAGKGAGVQSCKSENRLKSRPNLVALQAREQPNNVPLAFAIRRSKGG